MDKQKLIQSISRLVQRTGYFYPKDFTKDDFDDVDLDLLAEYNVKEVASVGGSGDGSECSLIIEASKDDQKVLFRIDGWKSSWDTKRFDDDAYECEEYEKIVKDWRAVK
jgi:hypothetical protein